MPCAVGGGGQIFSLWFDPIGAQIHHVPHSSTVHDFYSKYILPLHTYKNIITIKTIKLEYHNRQKKVYGTKVILSNTIREAFVCLISNSPLMSYDPNISMDYQTNKNNFATKQQTKRKQNKEKTYTICINKCEVSMLSS